MRFEDRMKPKKRSSRRSNFTFGATLAAFVMFLAAAALLVHASETKRWMAQMKADALARARKSEMPALSNAGDENRCPAAKPVLIGFDEQGQLKCRAVTSQTCPSGQYISSIDPRTLEIHCADAGGLLSCPTDSYITEFIWLGEGHLSYSCFQRLNPFRAWKFEPSLSIKGSR